MIPILPYPKVVIMPTMLPLAALYVVEATTSGTTTDDKVGIMRTLSVFSTVRVTQLKYALRGHSDLIPFRCQLHWSFWWQALYFYIFSSIFKKLQRKIHMWLWQLYHKKISDGLKKRGPYIEPPWLNVIHGLTLGTKVYIIISNQSEACISVIWPQYPGLGHLRIGSFTESVRSGPHGQLILCQIRRLQSMIYF